MTIVYPNASYTLRITNPHFALFVVVPVWVRFNDLQVNCFKITTIIVAVLLFSVRIILWNVITRVELFIYGWDRHNKQAIKDKNEIKRRLLFTVLL